jgi:hypothetical protein
LCKSLYKDKDVVIEEVFNDIIAEDWLIENLFVTLLNVILAILMNL